MTRALLLWALALLLQVIAGLGFWWISEAAYGNPPMLGEDLELQLTFAGLVLAGPLALVCVSWSAARWLHHVRTWIAVPAVLVLCLPSMLVGVAVSFTLACVRSWC
jgi:hypothetical protein